MTSQQYTFSPKNVIHDALDDKRKEYCDEVFRKFVNRFVFQIDPHTGDEDYIKQYYCCK